jgi:hypothetical protein
MYLLYVEMLKAQEYLLVATIDPAHGPEGDIDGFQ